MNATLQKSSRLCELNNFSNDKKPQYAQELSTEKM